MICQRMQGGVCAIIPEIWACLARLKDEGYAILLVDKHLDALPKFADRHVVFEKG